MHSSPAPNANCNAGARTARRQPRLGRLQTLLWLLLAGLAWLTVPSSWAEAAVTCGGVNASQIVAGTGNYAGWATLDARAKTCQGGAAVATPIDGLHIQLTFQDGNPLAAVSVTAVNNSIATTLTPSCAGTGCYQVASNTAIVMPSAGTASISYSYVDSTGATISFSLQTTAGGAAVGVQTSIQGFTVSGGIYDWAGPTLSKSTPSSGPVTGGTSVTLTGTALSGATSVKFGAKAAQSFSVVSATQISAVSPTGTVGAVDLSVTTPSGSWTLPAGYTYQLATQAPLTVTASLSALSVGGTATISSSGGSGTGAVTYAVSTGPNACSLSGTTLTALAPGSCTVVATKASDGTYAAVSASTSITVAKYDQAAFSATAYPNDIAVGQTASVVSAGGSGNGTITRAVTSGTSVCSLSGAIATGNAAGTCTITVTKAGDGTYNPATATVTISVGKTAQAPLTVSASPTPVPLGGSSALSTSGGSGTGAVTYEMASNNGACSITGSNVNGLLAFSCTVRAVKAGDATYAAATATTTLTVGGTTLQAPLSVAFNPATLAVGGTTTVSTVGGSGSGGAAFTLSSASTYVCSLSGSTITALSTGTCSINAAKAGDATYSAMYASGAITVSLATQAPLTLTSSPSAVPVGSTATLLTTGGSGNGAVGYSITSGSSSYCSLSGLTLTGIATGTCTVNATKAGDGRYGSITTSLDVPIGKLLQAPLTAQAASPTIKALATTSLSASGGSGTGAVSFSVSAGTSYCNVAGNTLNGLAAGTCTVTATKAGDATYAAATTTFDVVVQPATQPALNVTANPAAVKVGATSTLSSSGGAGSGAVTYAITSGASSCSLAGTTVTALALGSCTVTATKAGDATYAAAAGTTMVNVTAGQTQAPLALVANPQSILVGAASVLSTTGGSGAGAVTYAVTSGASNCWVSGNLVTGNVAGTCTVTATKAGDATYAPATATVTITVIKSAQAPFTVTAAPATVPLGGTSTLSFTGGSGGGAVSYAITSGTSFCSLSGATLTGLSPGICTVTATKAADANFNAATATVDVTVGKGAQAALSVTASPPTINALATTTLSTAGGSGTGAVSYAVTAGTSYCTIAGSTLTGNAAGTCTVTATKAGDANYVAATASVDVMVQQRAQPALNVAASPNAIQVAGTATLSTGGGAGSGAVSYAVTSGGAYCTLSGSTVTGQAVGTCTITATKAGDTVYGAATASVDVSVGKAAQAPLSASASPASIAVGSTSSLATSGGSGTGAVSYAVTSGNSFCSITGSTLTGKAAGSCRVTTTKAADANYASASASVTVTVTPASQVALSVTASPSSVTVGGSAALATTGGSGPGAVSYAVTSGAASCSLSGATLTGIASGNCTVTATKAADANYTAATATTTVAVSKAAQAPLSLTASPAQPVVGDKVTLAISGGSGTGTVNYAVTAGASYCSVAGATLTATAAGSCTITATKAADASYDTGTAALILTIGKAAQPALVVKSTPSSLVSGGTAQLSTIGGAGTGAVTYAVTSGTSSCIVTGSTLTASAVGSCTVTATKAADANYASASGSRIVDVAVATQTITFAKPADQAFKAGGHVALTATATSGLPVSFASTTTSVCTVSGSTVAMVAAGLCTIDAGQDGDTHYGAAVPVMRSFSLFGTAASLALSLSPSKPVPGQPVTITATITPAGATGSVTFTNGATTLCAGVVPNAGVATCSAVLAGAGQHTLGATFNGSGTYYGSATTSTQVAVGNPVEKSVAAAGRFLSQYSQMTAGNGFNGGRQMDRLREAGQAERARQAGEGAASGFAAASRLPGPDAVDLSRMWMGGRPRQPATDALAMRPTQFDDGMPSAPAAGLPLDVGGNTDGASRFSFSTSLSQMTRYGAAREAEKAGALGLRGSAYDLPHASFNPVDVWIEAKYASLRDKQAKIGVDGEFAVVSGGIDYVVNPSLLIGAFVQFDTLRQGSEMQDANSRGSGWLTGPYATLRLSENVFWQGRAGWGRVRSEIGGTSVSGDRFDSDRKLLATTLTGRWSYGPWTLQPGVDVTYVEQSAPGHLNADGLAVPALTNRLGQLKAGPQISYLLALGGGLMLEPRAGAQLVWDFDSATRAEGLVNVQDATAAAGAPLRMRADLGLRATTASGASLDLSGSYDGIGASGYSAFSGQASARLPLN